MHAKKCNVTQENGIYISFFGLFASTFCGGTLSKNFFSIFFNRAICTLSLFMLTDFHRISFEEAANAVLKSNSSF